MPTYQLLTDRTLAQSSAITPTTLIHIVYTGDPSQNIAGSSYKAELQQLSSIFSGGTDTLVTGGTYSAGTITFTNSSGGTFPVTGLTEPFTGGTVSGATNFTNGLTANTISATTYLNIPVPTLNQVLIQGNQTLGEDIILNDMDSIINTGNTIGIQYKTGDTMYQYVTNNVDKTTEISLDKEYITLNSTNNDDGWEVELQLDGQNGQMFETVTNSVGTSLSRTTRQAGSIDDYCGNSTNTDYSSVNQKDDQISSIIVSGSSEVTKWKLNNNQISGSTTNGVNTTLISLTPNNFRVETDNNQNIFFVDGTNNRVGISTNTPTEKLTVSGNTNITGTLNIGTIGAGTPLINLGLDVTGRVVTGTTGGGSFTGGSGNCIADLYVTNIHGCSPITIYDSIKSTGSTVLGQSSISFGFQTSATTDYSHAEGNQTIASGNSSHSEGQFTVAGGAYSHSEGELTTASGIGSHSEGQNTIASGWWSHAEGGPSSATTFFAHSEGSGTLAQGVSSHAEGVDTTTNVIAGGSHAEGYGTIAYEQYQHVSGRFNNTTNANQYFIIGRGTSNAARANALRVSSNGNLNIAGTLTQSSADYAEYFESLNGESIPFGTVVELENDKIKICENPNNAIGVISSNPSIVGNAEEGTADEWVGKYEKDEWGRKIMEDYIDDILIGFDENGNKIFRTVTKQSYKFSENFDPNVEYVKRENRPEWNVVGLLGQIRVLKNQQIPNRWIKMKDINNDIAIYLVR